MAQWQFTGGTFLEGDTLRPGDIAIEDETIRHNAATADHRIDARGLWILPGLVDLHGDGFERHVAPRRGMVTSMVTALGAVQEELSCCGITTAWLAQFWSWEGGMRAPAFMQRLADGLRGFTPEMRLDLRIQLRLETHMVEDFDPLSAFITEYGIEYLVFNDHLPHAALDKGKQPPRLNGSALKAARSPAAHLAEMHYRRSLSDQVPDFANRLIRAFPNLRTGSHDDPDVLTRQIWHQRGVVISEFPTSIDAAQAAKDTGTPVIMGAPNVVRGNSHNRGGIAADTLIRDGLVDALASDYHYPALAQSAFALSDRAIMPFAKAWGLVSQGPARLIGLTDRGTLDQGARADITVINPSTRRIIGTFANGAPVHLTGPLADRLT
ncbi:hypothetical protein BFP70_03280 [Thioclava sp. SK-1]|uniref:alpha-D-ribose 1-methylphosphonate 5-triphosphate diphosphatase n=1 Tax=Thioclava sp. SK-1 TaxID=1889770 RepID=UPI0008254834|nr:alpha-D-ribose 1-methylphosphonate 5-triphosphate diphosphatase [Thioclava sp. SK-1]OCX67190.1 hypothetical protein BFP70_03280 [Thioclava sp. SK-1]